MNQSGGMNDVTEERREVMKLEKATPRHAESKSLFDWRALKQKLSPAT
jgi:hypothetical protein